MSSGLVLDSDFGLAADVKRPEAIEPKKEPVAPKVFKREIDLGDGSGVQVFEAETQDGLIDKLTEAQRNATLKIKELNREVKGARSIEPEKREPLTKPVPTTLSQAEVEQLAIQLSTEPHVAFEKLFKAATGASPNEFAKTIAQVNDVVEVLQGAAAAEEFVAEHVEDYLPTPRNFAAIRKFLEAESLHTTKRNLDYAFYKLSAQGALDAPKPEQPVKPADEVRIEPKIETKPVVPPHTLSGKDTVASVPAADEVDALAEDIMTMPYEQARARIVSRLRQGQA